MTHDLGSVSQFYDDESPSYEADRFSDEAGRSGALRQVAIIRALIPQHDGRHVLDLGAGTGRITRLLLADGFQAIGVDMSVGMLRQARASSPEGQFIRGDAGRLPVADASVGGVVSVNVFSHAPNYRSIIEEAARVLEPGGFLMFNYINAHSIAYPFGLYVRRKNRGVRRNVYTRWDSPASISKILSASGFTLVERRGQAHLPPSLPQPVRRIQSILDRIFERPPLSRVAQIHWVCAVKRPS